MRLSHKVTQSKNKFFILLISLCIGMCFLSGCNTYDFFTNDDSVITDDINKTEANNPYSNKIFAILEIGNKFAEYEGSEFTQGITYEVSENEAIRVPVVKALPGFTFIGWSNGGVKEPDYDIFTTEMIFTPEKVNDNFIVLYALFADEQGNGYCTCGNYKEGYYSENLVEYKADYEQYLNENSIFSNVYISDKYIGFVVASIIILSIFLIALQFALRYTSVSKK